MLTVLLATLVTFSGPADATCYEAVVGPNAFTVFYCADVPEVGVLDSNGDLKAVTL